MRSSIIDGVSVIMCLFNSEKRVVNTLFYLSKQKNLSFPVEILIINNNSTDNSRSIVLNSWEKFDSKIPLLIIDEPRSGKANALETGYGHAKYQLLLLCDDDNWLNDCYLFNVINLFRKYPTIGMLGGYGERAWFGMENSEIPDWFEFHKYMYVIGNYIGQSGFLGPREDHIWGAGSVIRKDMWKFLTSSGFTFKNSKTKGRAQAEDAELSFIIALTGQLLYFDEKLTFVHDLSGGRVSLKNMKSKNILNAINLCWLNHYRVIEKQVLAVFNK